MTLSEEFGSFRAVRIQDKVHGFVHPFQTPPGIVCPHFYELKLGRGCPYSCAYCYLQGTYSRLPGGKAPVGYRAPWERVQGEIERAPMPPDSFNTGELSDSFAVPMPLLPSAIEWFRGQKDKYLICLSKASFPDWLRGFAPTPQVVLSWSLQSSGMVERLREPPLGLRQDAVGDALNGGWRTRVRLDPIVLDDERGWTAGEIRWVRDMRVEMVTLGTLRAYPNTYRLLPEWLRTDLVRSPEDGRYRYLVDWRLRVYKDIADLLGFQPALCKETEEVWEKLGWEFKGCNCLGRG